MDTAAAPAEATFSDTDLVYVDPDLRVVVGRVEWSGEERPKPLQVPDAAPETDDDGKPGRKRRKRYYPWGTYRSMKRLYKLEGKVRDERPLLTLDDAIARCLVEPFWD